MNAEQEAKQRCIAGDDQLVATIRQHRESVERVAVFGAAPGDDGLVRTVFAYMAARLAFTLAEVTEQG